MAGGLGTPGVVGTRLIPSRAASGVWKTLFWVSKKRFSRTSNQEYLHFSKTSKDEERKRKEQKPFEGSPAAGGKRSCQTGKKGRPKAWDKILGTGKPVSRVVWGPRVSWGPGWYHHAQQVGCGKHFFGCQKSVFPGHQIRNICTVGIY